MTIEEYILGYKNSDNEVVVNIFDYYDRYIKTLDKAFSRYNLRNGLVLCWFKEHEDANASMGVIPDKKHPGGYLFHCFGCGKAGNVIRLHQVIEAQYYNRYLTTEQACRELAERFSVPLGIEFEKMADLDGEALFDLKLEQLSNLERRYTSRDFSDALRSMRKRGDIDLNEVNTECVKMIATVKQMYN